MLGRDGWIHCPNPFLATKRPHHYCFSTCILFLLPLVSSFSSLSVPIPIKIYSKRAEKSPCGSLFPFTCDHSPRCFNKIPCRRWGKMMEMRYLKAAGMCMSWFVHETHKNPPSFSIHFSKFWATPPLYSIMWDKNKITIQINSCEGNLEPMSYGHQKELDRSRRKRLLNPPIIVIFIDKFVCEDKD